MENIQYTEVNFEGWDCVRLANSEAELIITTSIGPRIIRYGLLGGPNAFHVIPETRGQASGDSAWLPYGGHRLWHAPEVNPRSYHPDNSPYGTPVIENGTLKVSQLESTTGIVKEMVITLAPTGSAVKVEHLLTNKNIWPISISAWTLTIVANGGRVVLPQEPYISHDDELAPSRPLILWSFTEMGDPRWRWGSKYLSLTQVDELKRPQKVGAYNAQGWAAHLTDSQAYIVRIVPAPGGPAVLPDMGSNFETYTDGPFQELETLGPLVTLEPGATTSHTEYWHLAKISPIADTDAALDAALLPLVAEAKAQTSRYFGE